ncbi:MAG TPA: iron-containing alcohol dehydrogenase [Epulopiscium sp.]|nr:iron-containing alcohol dehydrogenase [Candidatus Epulonipiscium sp.]
MGQVHRVNMVKTNFFGSGSINQLPEEVKKRGYKRALLITDQFLYENSIAQQVCDKLKEVNVHSYIFYKVEPNPTVELVDQCLAVAKEVNPDFLIALGGGSPIDTCKAVSILFTNGGNVVEYEGVNKSRQKGLPIVAINTTAGTGSEVTSFYVITDKKRNSKMVMVDTNCMVDIAINDADFMVSMPKSLTAATGMDAMTHAIEAVLSKEATPFTDKDALWAITTIYKYLPKAVQDGSNLEVREMMAYAAYTAGIAFSNSGLGMVHAMAHSLGGFYNLPHGVCNAVLLPYVMKFNGKDPGAQEPFRKIANALGIKGMDWGGAQRAVNESIKEIQKLSRTVGIPQKLRDLQREDPKDFPVLAELALNDTCMPSNRITPTLEQVIEVYKEAY